MSSTTSAPCRYVAGAVADQLAAVDPTHATDYRSNAEKFTDQVHGIEATQRGIAAAHVGSAAIATEDIAQYLETAVGLTDRTPEGFFKAVAADSDPAPADIAAVLDIGELARRAGGALQPSDRHSGDSSHRGRREHGRGPGRGGA